MQLTFLEMLIIIFKKRGSRAKDISIKLKKIDKLFLTQLISFICG